MTLHAWVPGLQSVVASFQCNEHGIFLISTKAAFHDGFNLTLSAFCLTRITNVMVHVNQNGVCFRVQFSQGGSFLYCCTAGWHTLLGRSRVCSSDTEAVSCCSVTGSSCKWGTKSPLIPSEVLILNTDMHGKKSLLQQNLIIHDLRHGGSKLIESLQLDFYYLFTFQHAITIDIVSVWVNI